MKVEKSVLEKIAKDIEIEQIALVKDINEGDHASAMFCMQRIHEMEGIKDYLKQNTTITQIIKQAIK